METRFETVTSYKGVRYFIPSTMRIKFEALHKEISDTECDNEKEAVHRLKEAMFKPFEFPEEDEVERETSLTIPFSTGEKYDRRTKKRRLSKV